MTAPLSLYTTETLRRMADDLAAAADERTRILREIERREANDAITGREASPGSQWMTKGAGA